VRQAAPGFDAMLIERFDAFERALVEQLRRHYGPRLVSVAVFGSVGKGTPHPQSDLDVVIVVRDLPRGRFNQTAEFAPVEEALEPMVTSLRGEGIETRLSPVLKTPEEALSGSPLFLDCVEDARVLVDEGGLFRGILERLRARLEQLGARRIRFGSAWYWDLKPDVKPGEVFDL
jgi:predicted nucleotidyltransferase